MVFLCPSTVSGSRVEIHVCAFGEERNLFVCMCVHVQPEL